DTIKVYVFHGVSEANPSPLELQFVPNVSDSKVGEESFNEASNHNNQPPTSTYPSNPTIDPSETSNTSFEDQPTIVPPSSPFIVPPLSPSSNVPPPSPYTVPLPYCVPSYDPIIDNDPTADEVEDKSGYKGDTNEDIVVDRDFHQEYIDIRASKRLFKRSQRRSRGTTSYQINVDEKGPDIGYDETNIGIRESLVGKLGGDQPYYLSDEAPSFEIDDETGWGDGEKVDQVVHKPIRRKKTPNKVVFDETSEKVVWELGLVFGSVEEFRVAVTTYAVQEHIQIEKYVNDPSRVRVKYCKETCPWLLCASVCKGQLLVAVCRYGNNQMLPIAWAVVEVENQFTWTWFLELMKNDLDLGEGHQLSIIIDMQKGVEIVVQDVWPLVEHRKCARHVLANWCKNWKGIERRRVFWRIVNPYLKLS
ncbi:hypothetical protein MTR67_001010, partial [Solanum verrucosum]